MSGRNHDVQELPKCPRNNPARAPHTRIHHSCGTNAAAGYAVRSLQTAAVCRPWAACCCRVRC